VGDADAKALIDARSDPIERADEVVGDRAFELEGLEAVGAPEVAVQSSVRWHRRSRPWQLSTALSSERRPPGRLPGALVVGEGLEQDPLGLLELLVIPRMGASADVGPQRD